MTEGNLVTMEKRCIYIKRIRLETHALKLLIVSYVEIASYELVLLELQVTSYELNFKTASYKNILLPS